MPRTDIDWANLGFGFSEVNCHIRYVWKDGKWGEGEFVKDPFITMHIGASCLHYGQECFEGMKAFCQKDGKVVLFRPEENAKRMMRTAQRTVMPPVPVEMFIDAAERVVKANIEYVPPYGTGGSMYIRPLLIGTGPQIGVAPAREYKLIMMVNKIIAKPTFGKPMASIALNMISMILPRILVIHPIKAPSSCVKKSTFIYPPYIILKEPDHILL